MSAGGAGSGGAGAAGDGASMRLNFPPEILAIISKLKETATDPHEGIMEAIGRLAPEDSMKMVMAMASSGGLKGIESRFGPDGMPKKFGTSFLHLTRCEVEGCGAEGLRICARCGVQRVCSVECQRKLWSGHKASCALAARALAAAPARLELEFEFRGSGEDEVPIPAGMTTYCVRALAPGGLIVGKLTGAIMDVPALTAGGASDPYAAVAGYSSNNEQDIINLSRQLFVWGSGTVRPLHPAWPPTAAPGREVVLMLSMMRVSLAWRRRGIAAALVRGLLGHARTASHTLAAAIVASFDEDDAVAVSTGTALGAELYAAERALGAAGFRHVASMPESSVMVRAAAATHPARSVAIESERQRIIRCEFHNAIALAEQAECAAARGKGKKGAKLAKHMAEWWLATVLKAGGEARAAAHKADLASLERKWPRAVALARAKGVELVHLLNVRLSRNGQVTYKDDSRNVHDVIYDAALGFGELNEKEAAALGMPPAPAHRTEMGGAGCSIA